MKLVFIMTDTYRRDHIGAYGNPWIHTPNIDRLAAMSNVFDQHYIGSFPTLPNRRDMHLGTGDRGLPLNRWKKIEDDEVTLAQRITDMGIHNMMINDVANSCHQTRTVTNGISGMNFQRGFEFFLGNRGQEGDNTWLDMDVPLEYPVDPELIRYPALGWHKVLMNRAQRRFEDDWFAPGTFKLACEWIERNWKLDNFLLWVETFDPHEPWDPPQYYIDRYDPGYTGRIFDAPAYGRFKEFGITDAEIKNIHARYSGECAMVDTAVGRLLATLDKVNLLDEVAIIFTTDHGTYMGLPGDNDLLGKPHAVGADGKTMGGGKGMLKPVRHLAQYSGVCRIPLFVHLPGQSKSKRFRLITQPWDITPTVLELFGQKKAPPEFLGQSLLPVIEGKTKKIRNTAILGPSGAQFQAMTPDWSYTVFNNQAGLPPFLVDRKTDKSESRNVAKKNPAVCASLLKEIEKFVKRQKGVPEGYMSGFVTK
ncbi:MAG: sulfatase [Candidatus Sumerlaeota bacterium]|nr:sulfatase [Candidatus Sumerlaeota bacterium]